MQMCKNYVILKHCISWKFNVNVMKIAHKNKYQVYEKICDIKFLEQNAIFLLVYSFMQWNIFIFQLVTVEFKWFGLQNKVEGFIGTTERRLFLNFHRQVFCWTDKWHGMTMEDIRALEDKTKEELENQRMTGEVRGTKPL